MGRFGTMNGRIASQVSNLRPSLSTISATAAWIADDEVQQSVTAHVSRYLAKPARSLRLRGPQIRSQLCEGKGEYGTQASAGAIDDVERAAAAFRHAFNNGQTQARSTGFPPA